MIAPGTNPKDPSQAAATRAMLHALMMSPEQAAAAARVSLADMQALLEGRGHALAWGVLAERIVSAAGPERDQSPPRPLVIPTPAQVRRQARTYG